MTPKICVSIMPSDIPEVLKLIERAEKAKADFIEVRLDSLDKDCDLTALTAKRKTPLIATDKSPERDAAEHRALVLNAAKSSFQYVDIDLSTPKLKSLITEIHASKTKCIVSFHDNKGCPSLTKLQATLKKQMTEGADICKIVATATQVQDNLTILKFVSEASKQAKVVSFCMGELGRESRVQSPIYGAFFTFAALDSGCVTAPGQMTIREMRAAYDLLGL